MKSKIGIIAVISLFTTIFVMGCAEEKTAHVHKEKYKSATNVLQLNDANFEAEIKEGVVLVDFWAPWCPPCRKQGPIIEAVAKKVGRKAKIAKANVDEARTAANKFGISGIPTLIMFKDGQPVQKFVGLRKEEELLSAIEKIQ